MSAPVHVLDTGFSGRRGITAATLLETKEGIVLFDCGPESTFVNVVEELRSLGRSAKEVHHVFLSHIHLDHAGAAWRFAELGATIHVHPRGAAHLIDPTKLVESATRIFGDQMETLWGRVAPIPASRIRIANDNDLITIGNIGIRAIATPGHASHHNIYHWDNAIFGGDVAGVSIGGGVPVPPFVPPELHVESWLESIAKIRALNPEHLYLPHFGEVSRDLGGYHDALTERIQRWADWFRVALIDGRSDAELVPAFAAYEADDLRNFGASAAIIADYERADPSYMAVTAALRYWRRNHPEVCASE